MTILTLKLHWPSFGIGIGTMVGIAVVLFFVYGQMLEKNPDSTQVQSDTQTTLDLITGNASPELGSKDAPITMVEFGDYQCYYCNQFYHKTESDIVKNYIDTGKVRLVFKDFTIIGQDSVNAAHAAHCAQEQGKFWQYHDTLYNNWAGENTGWASSSNLLTFAKQESLDINQFNQCMSESRYVKIIEDSMSNAKDLGLTGTPDFFIIGTDHSVTKVVGAQPYEVFDEIFKSKLKS
jgi:protein-disulfide isomerase